MTTYIKIVKCINWANQALQELMRKYNRKCGQLVEAVSVKCPEKEHSRTAFNARRLMSASRQERDTDSRIARQARGVKAPSPVGFAGALHMVVVSRCIQADEWSLLSLLWFNVLVSSAATYEMLSSEGWEIL